MLKGFKAYAQQVASMMALDGKTIIKEEITEKDAYDAQTAAVAVAASASAAAAVNTNRNRNNNKANNNNNNSNSISTSKDSPTINGNNNNNSNSNNSNNSSSSNNNNTLIVTNGNRTPDSPEGTRIVAPRSPMSPQLHHSSLALAPPPPLPLPRPNRNASASPITSSPPPAQPPSAALAAAAAHIEQARMLGKIRKFLGSLVQLAQEVHPEVSERVRALVISLASGGITIDEFRLALQEAINLPLRPYVVPLLKQHIALLQREIAALSRATNQTTLQYVTTNENSVMEFAVHGPPAEYSDIFIQMQDAPQPPNANGGIVFKRRPSDSLPMEHHNGLQEWSEYMSAAKRLHTAYQPQLAAAAASVGHSIVGQPTLFEYAAGAGVATAAGDNGYGSGNHRDERDMRMATANEASQRHPAARPVMPTAAVGGGSNSNSSNNNASNAALVGGMPAAGGGEEEWKNIHTMLNCISAMVDKTKRAITILQQRGIEPQQPNCQEVTPATLAEIRRQTEEKVAEFKRNAEEAVNQVKRQAVIEIQRAIVAAETRSAEIMAQERLRMEKFLVDMSRHTSGEREREREREREIDNKSPSLAAAAQTACWNCGRKATETCSGCNFARYCGSFCQHRDWDSHHQICGTTRSSEHASKHAPPVGAQVLPLTAANLRGTMAIRSPPTPNALTPAHAQPTVTQAQQPATSSSSSGGGGGGGPPNSLVPNGIGSK